MGAWGRVCGPREALWLTILRRGTLWDSGALGKGTRPMGWLEAKKQAGLGPGALLV